MQKPHILPHIDILKLIIESQPRLHGRQKTEGQVRQIFKRESTGDVLLANKYVKIQG